LPQLKEKFLLNIQGFQVEHDFKEDFLLCIQREKDTLPNFYWRFLQMRAQALKVSDDQVITQAIKALRAGLLHNHLVREQPKTVLELYEQFAKFSKSEIQHFRMLEQQRKSQKQTKLLDLATMKASATTPNLCTTSTLMDVDHHSKQTIAPPSTRDLTSTTRGVDQ
jgi:hypothetical protein